MLLKVLQDIVNDKKRQDVPDAVIRNYLKEYLQYPILDFIYNSAEYNNFIFTGGSCLRVCFNGPRLSEDLDFDLSKTDWENFDIKILGENLSQVMREKYALPAEIRTQSNYRVYLKFPILKDLGLAKQNDSNLLFLKIEPNQASLPEEATEVTLISKYGYNFAARNYKKEFLMVGKIGAILNRLWFKGKGNEIDIKGRDFYDLYWYLQAGIEPDWKTLAKKTGISSRNELKEKIWQVLDKKVTAQKLAFDLKDFFPDQNFVDAFCENYKEIIGKYLK